MATFTDIVREQRKQGKGVGSSLKTAFSERAKERIDPRNYLFKKNSALTALFPSLGGYKAKTGAEKLKNDESKGFSENAENILNSVDRSLNLLKSQFKIVAKNSIVLPQMARDTNITRQNIQKLLKSLGVKPTYDNDMFFQNAKKRESQYQNQTKEKKPTKEKKIEEKEKKGFFATLLETIQDFIGPIISMIKGAVDSFLSIVSNVGKGLGFLGLLLGPEAALAAGFVALAAGLVYLANLIPKPSAESLEAIQKQKDEYANEMYRKYGPNAVTDPKQRERIEKEIKDKGGVITEKIEPVSSTDKSSSTPLAFKQDAPAPDDFFQSKLAKEKKEGGGKENKAGFLLNQANRALVNRALDAMGFERPQNPSITGSVSPPASANGMTIPLTPTKAEPFTKDLGNIVPLRSASGDVSAFKHREGVDLAVQAIINKGIGGSTINAVTGLNDKFHHKEAQGSLHTMGLAADFGLNKNASKEEINNTVANITAELTSAGLKPNEYLVQYEKMGDGKATAPHIHLQFANKDAAAKYAEHAKKAYDLSPSRYALNENKVPSQSDVSKATAAGNAPLSKDKASVAKTVMDAAAPVLNIEDSSKRKLKEVQELNRKANEGLLKDEKNTPISVIDNKTINTSTGGSGAPMLATADVYNNALEWYMGKMA
jgi:hypothetical protein